MATSTGGISSPGVGSGLDVNGIVSQLVALEARPLSTLQTAAAKIQTRLSAMGQLQSLVSGLRDAAGALADPASYTVLSAGSTDSSIATAAIAAGAQPASGSYAVTPLALATAQTNASAQGQFAASTDTAGSGKLTLCLGSWNDAQTAFTPKAGSSDVEISVAGTDTLATIRDKINAANAGVTAALITDTTGVRLTVRSNSTGAENGFRLRATDDDLSDTDASGLSRLAYDPAGGAGQLGRTVAAADARATVNGIEVRSATDTLTGVVEGLTIKLGKVSATPATLTVSPGTDSVKAAVNKFVNAYNALAKWIGEQTRYNAETRTAGLFQGDSAVVGLQTQMRSLVGAASLASPTQQTLSSLGIEQQKDGTLAVNGARLDSALGNLTEFAAALSRATPGQPMLTGAAVRLEAWADGLLESTGAIPGRTRSLQDRLSANQNDQARLADRLTQIEKRLRAQYSALDTTVSQLNNLSSYVSQQMTAIANFNKQSSSK
jgi:flagellar hook-associated protein 2